MIIEIDTLNYFLRLTYFLASIEGCISDPVFYYELYLKNELKATVV